MKNILLKLSNKHSQGVYTLGTTVPAIIKASLDHAKRHNSIIILEPNSIAVNQDGGTSKMNPETYRNMVYGIAETMDFDLSKIILAGANLGPLPWKHLTQEEAMLKAQRLVYDYAYHGYSKIHLSAVNPSLEEESEGALSLVDIAEKTALLAKFALQGYMDRLEAFPDSAFPVFTISNEPSWYFKENNRDGVYTTTKASKLLDSYEIFYAAFKKHKVLNVLENVIAMNVNVGIGFSNFKVSDYSWDKVHNLSKSLKDNFKKFNLEVAATDYQTPQALKEMVESGITILKLEHSLSLVYRQTLLSLAHIEDWLIKKPSNFAKVLTEVMLEDTELSTQATQIQKYIFTYHDVTAHYLNHPRVHKAIETLVTNLNDVKIPETLLAQYLPQHYKIVKEGKIQTDALSLLNASIHLLLDNYEFATFQSLL